MALGRERSLLLMERVRELRRRRRRKGRRIIIKSDLIKGFVRLVDTRGISLVEEECADSLGQQMA